MKRIQASAAPLRAALSALLLGACLVQVSPALGQANSNPPERMTYQGFLVGSDGVALGNTNPRNYDVVFRIFDAENAGNLLWAEQQTVTVDKGFFNVLLGEGSAVGARPALSSLFKGATASDRFVGITVNGIGVGGANVDILPRLRLMTSPYAFLAQNAVKLVQNNAGGADLLTSTDNVLTFNGHLDVLGNNSLEFGVGLTKQSDAGRIGYQLFGSPADSLDIVGAGTGNNRKVRIYAEGGLNVTGPITAPSITATHFGDGSSLTGVAKLGGNTFVGTQTISAGDLQLDNGRTFQAKNNTGNMENFLWPRWTDNVMYMNYGSGGLNVRNNNSATMLFLANNGRATFSNGVLAKGGNPGGGNVNNVGYAFSGNGGDDDSGMFSDLDGHVRFFSDGVLKLSVYPSGTYAHARLHAAAGLTLDTGYGRTFEVTEHWVRILDASNKGKYADWWRHGNGMSFELGGGTSQGGGATRYVVYDGDSNWDFSSDRRLKKDIVDAESMLERALKVQVRRYRWKDEDATAKHKLGVIAQEVQPIFPDLIGETPSKDGTEPTLTVGYSDFGLIAVKAIQEFKAQHDAEVKELKAQVADLKAQMKEVLQAAAELRGQAEKSKVTASVSQ